MEGMRRIKSLGAEKVYMDTTIPFYEQIGFRNRGILGHRWVRRG